MSQEVSVSLDEVLTNFGVFQKYHLITLVLISTAFISNSMYCVNYVFAAGEVRYRCKIHECETTNDENRSTIFDNWLNFTSADEDRCHRFAPLYNDSSCTASSFNYTNEIPCEEWVYEEQGSFVAEFDLACQEWKRTFIGTIHMTGLMVGLIFVGPFSDRFGRKFTIIATGVIGGVAGVLKSFSNSYWMYVIFEVMGSSLGDTCSPTFMLSMEIISKKSLVLYQTMLALSFPIGGIIIALIAWAVPHWRSFLRIIYAPALIFLLYYFYLDESSRWLLSTGKRSKAVSILKRAAKMNSIELDDKVLNRLKCEDDKSEQLELKYLLKTTFKSKILLKRFIICVVWWATCNFIGYGLLIATVYLDGNKYINFILTSLAEIPAGLILKYTLDRYGRQKPFCIASLTLGVLCVCQPFLPKEYVWLPILFYIVGRFIAMLTFNILYIYTSELFPTYTRNSMHALCSSLGRIGAICAPQIPLLYQYWTGLPTVLFGVSSLIAGLLTFLIPDTTDVELPDTIDQAERLSSKIIIC